MRNAVAHEVSGYAECKKPGDFYFVRHFGSPVPTGIVHACPCGCGQVGSINFRGYGGRQAEWDVSGEWPKATLSPSIGFWGQNSRDQGFHWHGYLRNGVFEEC